MRTIIILDYFTVSLLRSQRLACGDGDRNLLAAQAAEAAIAP